MPTFYWLSIYVSLVHGDDRNSGVLSRITDRTGSSLGESLTPLLTLESASLVFAEGKDGAKQVKY
jgi:hypothetical protein